MRRQTLYLIAPALILALTLSVAAVLPVTGQDTGLITDKLKILHDKLEGEKPALQNKVNAVIHQIEAGAFNGAVNKLQNDVKKSVTAWVENPEELLQLIDEIIDLIKGITPPPPPTPDFEISTLAYRLDVVQGLSDVTTLSITSINNFSQEVVLTATTTASDVTLTLDPATLTPPQNGSVASILKAEAATNALIGEYEINVTGKSGSLEHSIIIPLKITEAPPPPKDFTISASPTTLAIQQGRSNTSIITVTSINNFDDQVDLTITSASIAGVSATLNPENVIPPPNAYTISVLTMEVATDATLGTYNITVTGVSSVLQRSANVTLTILEPPVPPEPDFSLNAFPTSITIEQGDTRISAVIATSLRGFSGSITLAFSSGYISGVTLSLDPTQIILSPDDFATSKLEIEVAEDATLGEYEITVTGTSGALQRSASFSLKIVLETKPPKILSVSRLPEDAPAYNETVTVLANVVDLESGMKNVTLSYSAGATQQNKAMALDAGLYEATIPVFEYNEVVEYWVAASDNVGNSAVSSTYSYKVTDPYPPLMGTPTWLPEEPRTNEDITVNATITEPEHASGIKQVILQYSNETATFFVLMTDNHDGNWTAVISNQTGPQMSFLVKAIDHAGNTVESQTQEINVIAPASPLVWILAAIVILAAATGGGAYYVNRKRKQAEAPAT